MSRKFEVALNGSRYAIAFNLGAWSVIRRKGDKVTELLTRFHDVEDYDALQTLLWGMCWDNPSPPTLEEIGRLVTYGNVRDIRERILEVMQDSLPEPKEGASEDARPTKSGTGLDASASPTDPSDLLPTSSPI